MKLRNIFITALVLVGASLFSFSLLSHTNNFSIQATRAKQPNLEKYRNQQDQYLILNAQEIFGNNLTDTLSQVVAQHLAVNYPEGLSQFPTFNSNTSVAGFNQEEIGQGANALLTQVSKEMQYYRRTQDLNLVPNTSANKKQYLQDLSRAVSNNLAETANQGDLLSWYNQVVEKNDSQARKNLAVFTERSQKLLRELEQMSVPSVFAQLHLDYMNIVSETRYTALGLLLEQDDPVRTEVVLENYQGLNFRYLTYLSAFSKKIKQENIRL